MKREGRRDLRTREGRREEVLEWVRENGGFSIFWVTETQLRACVAFEMQQRGEMVARPGRFPWIKVTLRKDLRRAR